mmetsp:Transcript_29565/g.45385  ORF Transcript_29565/g.45385 Transcript_29565/m.45385 type:complete len:207 (-) Transcript_29565:1873-2493(-)
MPPPRIQIPSHVFAFSLLMAPGVFYGMYYQRNQKDEEYFQEELRKNYATNIQTSKAKRADMIQFVNSVRDGSVEKDNELNEVLKAGKDAMKRRDAVDQELYGTTKGLEEKTKIEQQLKETKEKRRRRQNNNNNNKNDTKEQGTNDKDIETTTNNKNKKEIEQDQNQKEQLPPTTTTTTTQHNILAVAGVGIAAATIGFLAGGKRSS